MDRLWVQSLWKFAGQRPNFRKPILQQEQISGAEDDFRCYPDTFKDILSWYAERLGDRPINGLGIKSIDVKVILHQDTQLHLKHFGRMQPDRPEILSVWIALQTS